jgi:hypothetical protein
MADAVVVLSLLVSRPFCTVYSEPAVHLKHARWYQNSRDPLDVERQSSDRGIVFASLKAISTASTPHQSVGFGCMPLLVYRQDSVHALGPSTSLVHACDQIV